MSDSMQRDPLPGNKGYTANIKYDTLVTYSANRKRDTWQTLGALTVDFNNKVFNRNSVFRLVNTTGNSCPLSGYFFFVANEDIQLPTSFSWSNMQIALDESGTPDGTIIDSTTHIIHPNIFWFMSPAEYAGIVIPFDDAFIPFSELQGMGVDPNSKVIIDDDDLNQILIDLGTPFIKIEELEFTKSEILNLMILPAMKEYFKWYPIQTKMVYPTGNTFFSIDIPSFATGVVTAYVNPTVLSGSSPGNPFTYFGELAYGGAPGIPAPTVNLNGRRRRGFPDTQALSTAILERAARQGVMNYAKRQRIAVHIQQGKVTGYSNITGTLEITWASFSNQWNDIPFNRQTEVRDLAKAYVLDAFGSLRGQVNSNIPGSIKYEGFIQKAEKLKTEVITLWKESTKAGIVR